MSKRKPQFSYDLLLDLQGHQCFYCSKTLANIGHCSKTARNGYTRDHFFPKFWGNRLLGNMVLSCSKCNRKKGCQMPTRDEIHRFHALWSQIHGGTAIDLSEFFEIQRLIDYTHKLIGPRVDTRYII